MEATLCGCSARKSYKIAYASSVDDGIHWHRQNTDQLIANSLGEDECQALPTVIKHNGLFHMIFCFVKPLGFEIKRITDIAWATLTLSI